MHDNLYCINLILLFRINLKNLIDFALYLYFFFYKEIGRDVVYTNVRI